MSTDDDTEARALRRERRRAEALRDAEIYRATAHEPDDLNELAAWAAHQPIGLP